MNNLGICSSNTAIGNFGAAGITSIQWTRIRPGFRITSSISWNRINLATVELAISKEPVYGPQVAEMQMSDRRNVCQGVAGRKPYRPRMKNPGYAGGLLSLLQGRNSSVTRFRTH